MRVCLFRHSRAPEKANTPVGQSLEPVNRHGRGRHRRCGAGRAPRPVTIEVDDVRPRGRARVPESPGRYGGVARPLRAAARPDGQRHLRTAFKAEVQPVEIAAALQREMDDRAADRQPRAHGGPQHLRRRAAPARPRPALDVYAGTLTEELAGMVARVRRASSATRSSAAVDVRARRGRRPGDRRVPGAQRGQGRGRRRTRGAADADRPAGRAPGTRGSSSAPTSRTRSPAAGHPPRPRHRRRHPRSTTPGSPAHHAEIILGRPRSCCATSGRRTARSSTASQVARDRRCTTARGSSSGRPRLTFRAG